MNNSPLTHLMPLIPLISPTELPDTLRDNHERAKRWARHIVETSSVELQPVAFVEGLTDHIIVPLGLTPSKQVATDLIRQVCIKYNASGYTFVSEAWQAIVDKNVEHSYLSKLPPSERPDRDEILVVSTVTKDRRAVYEKATITGTKSNRRLGSFETLCGEIGFHNFVVEWSTKVDAS